MYMTMEQYNYWAAPGTRSNEAWNALQATQRATDSAPAEVDPQKDPELQTQTRVAKAAQRIAVQRTESGNDVGEIPPSPPTVREVADACIGKLNRLLGRQAREARDAAIRRSERAAAKKERTMRMLDQREFDDARARLRARRQARYGRSRARYGHYSC